MREPYFIFYQTAMVLSLLASLSVIALAWQRRQAPGARAMIALTASTFVWTLGFLLEANSGTLERQLFFNNVGYIGSMSVPVAWFFFALRYTSDNRLITGWRIPLFGIIPLATVVLVWTNGAHHLMWYNEHLTTSGPFTVTAKTYVIFFWVALAYNYTLIITGAIILIRRLFVGLPLYTGQIVSLLVAVSLPLIWNFIYVFDLVPLPHKDLTPVTFAISGIAITLGLMRFQLFRAIPFARKFIIQQLSDGILVFDKQNHLLEANPAAFKILGANNNIIGKGKEHLTLLAPVLERLSSANPGKKELSLTVSGENRIYELEVVAMRDNECRLVGWLVILRDINEQRLAEAQKEELENSAQLMSRLSTMGEMAAGIAHEISNPLTSVIGYADLLLKSNVPAEVKKDLEVIDRGAKRAADILDRMLTFTGQRDTERDYVNINQIAEIAIEFRRFSLSRHNIEVIRKFDSGLPEIKANGSQLQDVFLNLIMNAEYSMSETCGGGRLEITTGRVDGKVFISFKDNGAGISRDNLGKIFQPFFTTKPAGIGTGLGLSISHGIIAAHGGKIYAVSEAGEGATLVIELPLVSPNGRAIIEK